MLAKALTKFKRIAMVLFGLFQTCIYVLPFSSAPNEISCKNNIPTSFGIEWQIVLPASQRRYQNKSLNDKRSIEQTSGKTTDATLEAGVDRFVFKVRNEKEIIISLKLNKFSMEQVWWPYNCNLR